MDKVLSLGLNDTHKNNCYLFRYLDQLICLGVFIAKSSDEYIVSSRITFAKLQYFSWLLILSTVDWNTCLTSIATLYGSEDLLLSALLPHSTNPYLFDSVLFDWQDTTRNERACAPKSGNA